MLIAFTWSVYQFTYVPSSDIETDESNNIDESYQRNNSRNLESGDIVTENDFLRENKNSSSGIGSYGSTQHLIQNPNGQRGMCKCCNIDVCENFLLLLMHDGPFLILRTYLIFAYHVMSEITCFSQLKTPWW